ncbi:MAG: glycosyltransferase [Clostridia bacterium]|nr:glycosyltransferase [Clostridia bacterium]
MARIKLAYVTHGLSSNGIESLLVSIAQRIDREKYDVTFVLALDPDVIPLHEETILSLGMRVIHVCDLDTLAKKRQYASSLRTIFARERFDIVHANMDLLNGIVLRAAKQAGISRRICHSHNSKTQYAVGDGMSLRKIAQRAYRFVMRRLILRYSTDLLGCSDTANAYMYGDRPAVVIHNGTDLRRFRLARETGDAAPELREASVHLCTVGRVSAQKNPLFLVSVAEELYKLRQDFVLHWAGTGGMLEAVRQAVEARGLESCVQLLGLRTDIPQIMAGCTYFLLPSLFEGLPVVLVEAQASGLTCFVSSEVSAQTDAGGCRFLPLDIGAAGWAKAVDEAIRSGLHLAADPEKMRLFDIANTVEELDRIYSGR